MAELRHPDAPPLPPLASADRAALRAAVARMRRWCDAASDPMLALIYDHELEGLALAALGLACPEPVEGEAARG
jgi:hypothetical protein